MHIHCHLDKIIYFKREIKNIYWALKPWLEHRKKSRESVKNICAWKEIENTWKIYVKREITANTYIVKLLKRWKFRENNLTQPLKNVLRRDRMAVDPVIRLTKAIVHLIYYKN